MSWRIVVISRRAKLELQMNYMVIRNDTTLKIHLSEIYQLLIESTAVSITTSLLVELIKRKINIIFCDEKRLPCGNVVSYYGSHDTSQKYKRQMSWNKKIKDLIWTEIITEKIRKQSYFLEELGKVKELNLLENYIEQIQIGDETNREGHAAKVYFNELFGKDFVRNESDNINAALNYGYAILLSTINKEVISNGYLTQMGIHHKNEFNEFNLSCDLMEPFRIVIDNFVYYNQEKELNTEFKLDIVNIFNSRYTYENKKYTLKDIIKLYVKNTLEALDEPDKYKEFSIYEG